MLPLSSALRFIRDHSSSEDDTKTALWWKVAEQRESNMESLVCLDAHLSPAPSGNIRSNLRFRKLHNSLYSHKTNPSGRRLHNKSVFSSLWHCCMAYWNLALKITHGHCKNSIDISDITTFLHHAEILRVFRFEELHSYYSTHFSTLHPKCNCGCNCSFWPCCFLLWASIQN